MSDTAIRAASLGKVFRVWRHPSDILKEALTGRRHHSEFEALRDVSFDVARGSVVGIMGRNGAGKSTLLRIIAGTLDATSGRVSVAGRISAILELGTGFHPEYSGRENVFLGGLCLGLTRAEIAARLDEIVAFAELEEFIDRPFRTFSSGMQARLTFAVATAVDPDILIIDEALAVGDARFALKSFDRVRQFRRQGKSILLVSHNINQVVSICDRALLLEKGRILRTGRAERSRKHLSRTAVRTAGSFDTVFVGARFGHLRGRYARGQSRVSSRRRSRSEPFTTRSGARWC